MDSASKHHVTRRGVVRAGLIGGVCAWRAASERLRVKPRLTVWLIAEQFRSDYLTRAASFPVGGLRRLFEEGALFPDCRMLSTTFTSTGLATLSTGTWASGHGVVGERWYDAGKKTVVTASGRQMQAPALLEGDARTARARVFTLAHSAGHAELLTGQRAGLGFWREGGIFRATRSVEWLETFNRGHAAARFGNESWKRQGDPSGAPALRVLKNGAEFEALFTASPFAQADEFELLLELIQREHLGGVTAGQDVAVVLLESLGKLAVQEGAGSPLMDDMLARLDRQVAGLLELLNARLGASNFQVIFSACHGAGVTPGADRYVEAQSVAGAMESALEAEFGKTQPGERFVEAYVTPFLYLRAGRIPSGELARARLLACRAAMETGKVAGFLTADGACSYQGDWAARLRNGFYPGRSGDAMLTYPAGFMEAFSGARGTSFGSVYNYDAQVPVCFFGTAFRAARFDGTVEVTSVAPTIAASLGWALPAAATGRILGEAFGDGT